MLSISLTTAVVAQTEKEYSIEVIKLWEGESVPFNKEEISAKEKLDSVGIRYTQISEPALYIYRKTKSRDSGAALLFCPGGGYAVVAIGKENGESKAKRFLDMGFDVVGVLKYRLPDGAIVNHQNLVPLCDAQMALAIFHRNVVKWNIDSDKIGVAGSSAGGHLAASLANLTNDIVAPGVKKSELKHAVSILMYPVISFNLPHRHRGSFRRLLGDKQDDKLLLDYYSMENRVCKDTPPTYLIHARDDVSVSYDNSLIYSEGLKKYKVPHELVLLEKGGHGFGFNFKRTEGDWTIGLKEWLQQTGILNFEP